MNTVPWLPGPPSQYCSQWVRCPGWGWESAVVSYLPEIKQAMKKKRVDFYTVSRFRIGFKTDPDPALRSMRIHGSGPTVLMTKYGKIHSWKKNLYIFLYKKLQFTYSYASIKYVKAKGDAFRTTSFSKQEISSLFSFSIFRGNFCLIRLTKSNADPCEYGSATLLSWKLSNFINRKQNQSIITVHHR